MARIRSALEIALERTEDVAADPEKIRISELEKRGKRLMGSYLFEHDATIESLSSDYAAVSEEDTPIIRKQMIETLLANISLPQDDLYVQQLGRIKQAVVFLAGKDPMVDQLFSHLDQIFQQYLQARDQLLEMAKQQYAPALKQKEEQMSQQLGRPIRIQPEQDPEFIKLLEANYKHLEDNYSQAVDSAKEQIRELL